MRLSALIFILVAFVLGIPKTSRAWEPMRTSDGLVLAWEDFDAFSLCALSGEAELGLAAWLGAGVWWNHGFAAQIELISEPCGQLPDDGQVGLVWASELGGWPDYYGPDDAAVAITIHTYGVSSGRISDADILINDDAFRFSVGGLEDSSYDIAYVVAHEMGHVLGLGHPCGDPSSTFPSCEESPEDSNFEESLMYIRGPIGPRSLSLAEDDLTGLSAVTGALGTPARAADLTWEISANEHRPLYQGEAVESWAQLVEAGQILWVGGEAPLPITDEALVLIKLADGATHFYSLSSPTPPTAGSEADEGSCSSTGFRAHSLSGLLFFSLLLCFSYPFCRWLTSRKSRCSNTLSR